MLLEKFMNRPSNNKKEIDEYNQQVADMFKDLPPFTITVNDGHDAAWISSAMLAWLAGSDNDLSEKFMQAMIGLAKKHGVEKGITMFIEEGSRHGHKFPKFLTPVFIHMFKHVIKDPNEE